ncbi:MULTISPECIES: dTMP kinase [Gemella]|uniref:dTMP kinase n=1 Tax=Gemella TaxID=1378 RepID=UPI00076821F0|nr:MULTISPECIES: dTMP kinase [Gemella]AME09321.1 thymidylate kinase [Gemella sp. oral taxon 928]AXI26955.1 dTMP kinase [Gemella sp. ND 6198]
MKGKFITVEGTDGSGKTTFLQFITKYLVNKGYKVILTREPGGTEFSEKVRELLFDSNNRIDAKTESLLFCASRRDHIINKIIPYIEKGYIVICDRFVDSSIAYQSYGRGLEKSDIININKYTTDGLEPDLTIYFSVDVKIGLNRTKNRDNNNRMDLEEFSFYERVKQGYDELSLEYNKRIKTIDANKPYNIVEKEALEVVEGFLNDENI